MNQRTADANDEDAIVTAEIAWTKKPYLRPQLVRLGTLADMTRTVGSRGAADGGRMRGRTRTSA